MSEIRPMAYPPGTIKYLGTNVRGLVSILGEKIPPLRFSDNKSDKHILKFNMDDDIEKKQYLAATDPENRDFKSGKIKIVLSPEEIAQKRKEEKQKENLELLKKQVDSGYVKLDLYTLDIDQLEKLGEDIGAQTMQKNRRGYSRCNRETLLANIREKLGIEVKKRTPDNNEGE